MQSGFFPGRQIEEPCEFGVFVDQSAIWNICRFCGRLIEDPYKSTVENRQIQICSFKLAGSVSMIQPNYNALTHSDETGPALRFTSLKTLQIQIANSKPYNSKFQNEYFIFKTHGVKVRYTVCMHGL